MKEKSNVKMLYLSALAMILVVLGHLQGTGATFLTFDRLFDYYAVHLPLFLFVSGYFFKEDYERRIDIFLLKKAKSLLIPFFCCNLFFLLLQTFLRRFGFTIGDGFSFYNFLIRPWLSTQPLTLAIPSWYLIAYFLSCVYYVLFRKLFSFFLRKKAVKEYALLFFFLALGALCVLLNKRFAANETPTVYLRSGVMLFFIQLGYVYKTFWEEKDKIPNRIYFPVVILLRFCVIGVSLLKGANLSYGLYGLVDFRCGGLLFYASGVLGIAFFLRIAALLEQHPKKSKLLMEIGRQTKVIMLFHLTGFFLLNLVFYAVSFFAPALNFDREAFFSDVYYTVNNSPRYALLYLTFGIGFSLLIAQTVTRIRKKAGATVRRGEKTPPDKSGKGSL